MKNKKNLYLTLILFSYPLASIWVSILGIFMARLIALANIALIMTTISIIIFALLKYREEELK